MDGEWDYVIVGSGFGGSVSALRLVEKGYRVLVLERGRRFRKRDFPKSNWDLKNYMWIPRVNWRGIFNMTFLPHVTVVSGVGVGGGSLVYANTLPTPKDEFFTAPSWGKLADWKGELTEQGALMCFWVAFTCDTHVGGPCRSVVQMEPVDKPNRTAVRG